MKLLQMECGGLSHEATKGDTTEHAGFLCIVDVVVDAAIGRIPIHDVRQTAAPHRLLL